MTRYVRPSRRLSLAGGRLLRPAVANQLLGRVTNGDGTGHDGQRPHGTVRQILERASVLMFTHRRRSALQFLNQSEYSGEQEIKRMFATILVYATRFSSGGA